MKYSFQLWLVTALLLLITGPAISQGGQFQVPAPTLPEITYPAQAFKNITLHLPGGGTVAKASIVWRNGVLADLGTNINIPFDAHTIDGGDSLHVYAGFIDGLSNWGAPELPRQLERPPKPGEPSYERAGIQPDRSTIGLIKSDAPEFLAARNYGFTMSAIGLNGFMLPGQIDIYHITGSQTSDNIFRKYVGQKTSFTGSRGVYPNTTMGIMARMRQLFYDAKAQYDHQILYNQNPTSYSLPGSDVVLEAMYSLVNKETSFFFIADTRDDIARAIKLSDELGFKLVLVSGKYAYTQSSELVRRSIPVLVTLDISDTTPWLEENKSRRDTVVAVEPSEEEKRWRSRQQNAWNDQVSNIRRLIDAGVTVGYASNGLRLADFRKKLDILTENGGLSEVEISDILSKNNAIILGIDAFIGEMTKGKIASMTVMSGPITDKESKIIFTVSAGELYEVPKTPARSGPMMRRN